jgi:predicted nucleic acid-binding protein
MAVYLLDSSIIIDALNARRDRNTFLFDLVERGHTLGCCPVNVAEIYAGMKPREEQRTAALLHSLQFFPVTFAIAEMAGRLKHEHGRKGITLALPDTIVAAVAIHHRIALLTDNARDFPMKEIELYPLPRPV